MRDKIVAGMYVQHKNQKKKYYLHPDKKYAKNDCCTAKVIEVIDSKAMINGDGFWFVDNVVPSTKLLHRIYNFVVLCLYFLKANK